MLNMLRESARTWVAKVLLLLLILSLAIWGISGQILGGQGGDVVLDTGQTVVTAQQYRRAYDLQVARESQRLGTRLSREQARLFGIDQAVRAQLVGGAVLDEQARVMGLGLSEDRLAGLIAEETAFHGLDGRFDRQQFRQVLAQVGMSESDYIMDLENTAIRQQIVEAVSDGISAPDIFLDALHRYQDQTRDLSFVEIEAGDLPPVAEPTDAELIAFFEDNLAAYRAPEYRTIQYVLLTPDTIADPSSVSDATVRAEYEDNQARYAFVETRTIQQIVFPDEDAAQAARERIEAGEDFEAIAAEMDRSVDDITLGTFERAQLPNQAVADAAFALTDPGAVSDVIDGPFGPILVRVTEITPERVRPFEEVEDDIRRELALLEARDILLDIHDGYEDARAGGASMAEAAATQRLDVTIAPPADRQGLGIDGNRLAALPEAGALLEAAFAAQIGEESRPINAGREGFLWYEVVDIDQARDRALDEVRARVAADWRADQVEAALDAAAEAVAASMRNGVEVATVADENGYRSGNRFGIARETSGDPDFGNEAVIAVFEAGPNAVGIAPGADGDSRLVFRIDTIANPPGGAEQLADGLADAIAFNLTDDLLNQMVNRLQQEFPVTLYPAALERALDAGVHSGM